MAVSLSKGSNVSLTKEAPGLTAIKIGLGWDARTTSGAQFDVDASAIVTDVDGQALSQDYFVFYGHKATADGTVVHSGDNLTGEGAGDDEVIQVNLAGLPAEAASVKVVIAIYQAESNGQTFGQIRNAFSRVLNAADDAEIARYDLSEDFSTETALLVAEVYRNGAEWKYRAIGQGYSNGLAGVAADFGIQAG